MIIDRIDLAGPEAYFQQRGNPTQINLAAQATSRTHPVGKGRQLEISAIELLIESDQDLGALFNFQATPLFSITVMKEMFPALFAEPYRHRVHNIGGFEDFKRGTLENAKAMDIDGVPTIVSVGTGVCKWTSPIYAMPVPIRLTQASWELAASRKTAAESFQYSLKLSALDAARAPIGTLHLTNPSNPAQPGRLDPTWPRKAQNLNLEKVSFYQVEFAAEVSKDAAVYEKHSSLIGESIGTPLLRAVNLLEPVVSIYDVHSLQELLHRSSEYYLFAFLGQPIKKMLVSLGLSATLVHSEYQEIANNDPYDPNSAYEFVQVAVLTDKFSKFEARLTGEVLTRPV